MDWWCICCFSSLGGVVHQDRNANMSATLHDIFSDKVRVILTNFKDEVVNAVKASGWDGQDDMDETKLQWSFAGALLYAVTVITTIGQSIVPRDCSAWLPVRAINK